MIYQRKTDDGYKRWFAWRPVRLLGPGEWTRMKRTGKPARWVWLEYVGRMRTGRMTYYAAWNA